ncbi:hypothetical protein AAE021_16800 [Arthrobacter citreus]|jgi:hypothetical protein|uniref:Uncharacterized protein n=1 Tax=Arthrobacter citreus TaxID=1670 RepID=A0ABZ2ZX53_9MICC
MRIRYYKPFDPNQLTSLGLPTDPTDTQGLALLSTGTLQGLISRVYEQLDSDYPSMEAADWYNALHDALRERANGPEVLERPA